MIQHFNSKSFSTGMRCAALLNLRTPGFVPASWGASTEPLRQDPFNGHYFLFRGRPTVLVGNSKHYGAVMNRDFNYLRYLDTLKAENLNVTRLFTGVYCEPEESVTWGQTGNVLASEASACLTPWPRSEQVGAADGLNKIDLQRWDETYFDRLHGFVRAASERGIAVEVVLFRNYYQEREWTLSPLNIHGIHKKSHAQ